MIRDDILMVFIWLLLIKSVVNLLLMLLTCLYSLLSSCPTILNDMMIMINNNIFSAWLDWIWYKQQHTAKHQKRNKHLSSSTLFIAFLDIRHFFLPPSSSSHIELDDSLPLIWSINGLVMYQNFYDYYSLLTYFVRFLSI